MARSTTVAAGHIVIARGGGDPAQWIYRRPSNCWGGTTLGTGNMRPKVEAATDFVRGGGRRAVIAALAGGLAALEGTTGATISAEPA